MSYYLQRKNSPPNRRVNPSIANDVPNFHPLAKSISSVSGTTVEPVESVPPSRLSDATPEGPEDGSDRPPDVDKTRRTRRVTRIVEAEKEVTTPLPKGLNVLWTPEDLGSSPIATTPSAPTDTASTSPGSPPHNPLPPGGLFAEILNNLLITLHPHTQHRATYATASSSLTEPTLGLYCPIEGGDYIIDETVKELARRTGSEVVVLDAVQLAGGEWGEFGEGRHFQENTRSGTEALLFLNSRFCITTSSKSFTFQAPSFAFKQKTKSRTRRVGC